MRGDARRRKGITQRNGPDARPSDAGKLPHVLGTSVGAKLVLRRRSGVRRRDGISQLDLPTARRFSCVNTHAFILSLAVSDLFRLLPPTYRNGQRRRKLARRSDSECCRRAPAGTPRGGSGARAHARLRDVPTAHVPFPAGPHALTACMCRTDATRRRTRQYSCGLRASLLHTPVTRQGGTAVIAVGARRKHDRVAVGGQNFTLSHFPENAQRGRP